MYVLKAKNTERKLFLTSDNACWCDREYSFTENVKEATYADSESNMLTVLKDIKHFISKRQVVKLEKLEFKVYQLNQQEEEILLNKEVTK